MSCQWRGVLHVYLRIGEGPKWRRGDRHLIKSSVSRRHYGVSETNQPYSEGLFMFSDRTTYMTIHRQHRCVWISHETSFAWNSHAAIFPVYGSIRCPIPFYEWTQSSDMYSTEGKKTFPKCHQLSWRKAGGGGGEKGGKMGEMGKEGPVKKQGQKKKE